MPFAVNKGVRIHYEVEGAGPPLVLHHGFAGCAQDWRDYGLTAGLAKNNRLIILDARGCGGSDKPHDPSAYEPTVRVSDVAAVLDDLEISKAHYYGHSYGGVLAYALAKYIPERIASFIISGAHPYAVNTYGFRDVLSQGIEPFLSLCDKMYGPYMTPEARARLAASDTAALIAASSLVRADHSDVLATMRMPCLLLAGALDQPISDHMHKAAPLLPSAQLVVLPDCDHVGMFARSEVVLPHVTAFLSKAAQVK